MNKYIVVPPCGISPSGSLPFFVKQRLDLAYKLFHAKAYKKIVVGGRWSYALPEHPKTTEAAAMTQYLQELGCRKQDIVSEHKSEDLLGFCCAVKMLLEQKNPTKLLIITTAIQKERTTYVFNKVFGKSLEIDVRDVPDTFATQTLWMIFRHEQKAMQVIKDALKRVRTGDHHTIMALLTAEKLYAKDTLGKTALAVYFRKLGKPAKITPHYSLVTIQRKRKEIYTTYGLTEPKRKKALYDDFWSGRFLSFMARDEEKNYYSLKFVLRPKDKRSFQREIQLSETLQKQCDFVPKIIDMHINTTPVWYLYKIVAGKTSGRFSSQFSFDSTFYTPYVATGLISHLSELRSVNIAKFEPNIWNAAHYSKMLNKHVRPYRNHPLFTRKRVVNTIDVLKRSIEIFDQTPLYTSHCDLHPANIIISHKRKQVYLIDFEHTAHNNIAFDFCLLYLFSWDNPAFQTRLLHLFRDSLTPEERMSFDEIFPYSYSFLLLWLLKFVIRWQHITLRQRHTDVRAYIMSELKRLQSQQVKK